jgi:hypothetical protein
VGSRGRVQGLLHAVVDQGEKMNATPKNVGMKYYAIAWLCLMLSASVFAGDEGYRTFSDTQGHSFKGRLIDYKAASESVVLKRSDGIAGRVKLARFSDADRLFILEWAAERRFQEELELVPSLNSTAVSKKESGISDPGKRVYDVFYEIRFINRSDAPFEKLDFEYCIFYNQGEREGRTIHYEEGSCYGADIVEGLAPSSEQVDETRTIRLYTEGGKVGLFGTDVVSLAHVRGIWLRLKTRLPSGREIEREYRTSNDELWEWSPYTFGAGLNEGERKQTYYHVK